MNWTEVQVTTTAEAEDAVVNIFYDAGAQGVAVESSNNLLVIKDDPTVNAVDESILNMDPEISVVRGYFSEEWGVDACIDKLLDGLRYLPETGLHHGECEMSIREMADEDWVNSWKEFFKPTRIGKRIVIKPSWEHFEKKPQDIVIEMDPGMAFGSGTHETTQLCVRALEQHLKEGDHVIDIGCGSGILSIVAKELGAKKVIAIDLDPVAVDVAKTNFAHNQMEGVISLRQGDLTEVLGPEDQADIVVANIMADTIITLSETVSDFLKPGGLFISSGIINESIGKVLIALEEKGYELISLESIGEWNVIVAGRK
ncbi:MAG: 50S ribosomal protein L11 methyltransferase [Eubacteriaceae bacterium]|jgi:ribosomal protein L11 methyltransferase|nr:50S ribosomal protein L11 methyltransferase [Eubacteriaceae bacterium]